MFKPKFFLNKKEEEAIISAIKKVEKDTSGEIVVHIESKAKKPILARAEEVFLSLDISKTKQRNAVLFYVAVKDKQFAVLGDEGIDKLVPDNYWGEIVQLLRKHLSEGNPTKALIIGIERVGKKLQDYFPYQQDDSNELSDEISFGS